MGPITDTSIGSDGSMVPAMGQAIFWNNGG